MAIPTFDKHGNLRPGIHDVTWSELARRFGTTAQRRALLDGLKRALLELKAAGCHTAYVDGSFVTEKVVPSDYDGCWEDDGVDLSKLDPVLQDFSKKRAAQKAKYLGEMFPASWPADAAGRAFLEFFQSDRDGDPKGLLRLDLRRLR